MRQFATLAVSLVIIAVTAGAAPTPVDNMLKHVPDDAVYSLVVPNLNQGFEGVKTFASGIGVPDEQLMAFNAEMALAMVTSLVGVDTDGAFVIAKGKQQSEIIMLTLKDKAAWLQETQAQSVDGIVVFAGPFGTEKVGLIAGNVLIIGDSEEAIMGAKSSTGVFMKSFKRHAGSMVADKAAVFYFNMESVRQDALGMVAMGQMMLPGMAQEMPPIGLEMAKFGMGCATSLINEIDCVIAGATVDEKAVHINSVLLTKKDGELVKYLAKVEKPKQHLFEGVPTGQIPYAVALNWKTPSGTSSLLNQWFDIIAKNIDTIKGDKEQIAEVKTGIAQLQKALDTMYGFNGAVMAGEDQQLQMAGTYFTSEPKLLIEAWKTSYDWMSSAMELMEANATATTSPTETPKTPEFDMKAVWRSAKVANQPVDWGVLTFSSSDPMADQMLKTMYGENTNVIFAPTKKGVVTTFGAETWVEKMMETMLTGKGKTLDKDPAVKKALTSAPVPPNAALLMDPVAIFNMVSKMGPVAGMPMMLPPIAATDTNYIAFTLGIDKGMIAVDIDVPAASIKPIMTTMTQGMQPPQ